MQRFEATGAWHDGTGKYVLYSDHLIALEAEREGWIKQHEQDIADNNAICLKLDEVRKQIAKLIKFKQAVENDRCTECPFLEEETDRMKQIATLTADNGELVSQICEVVQENERLRDTIGLLVGFVPNGWEMPLGYTQIVSQAQAALGEKGHN